MNPYPIFTEGRFKFLLLMALSFVVSCTSTTVDEFRQGETGISDDETVVVLGRRQASDYETRSEFIECVGDKMARGDNAQYYS
jgi:hypothetical protein